MIPIKNIFYMLSYAFQVLNEQGFKSIETEEFDNVGDLCAAILAKGVSKQLKQGLNREYIEHTEQLSALRGRIDITESVKTRSMLKRQMVCTYDEFSTNSYMNRIIKTTMELLIRSDIAKTRKKELRKLLVFFANVDTLDPYLINWNQQYNRNNQTYRMLISICYLVIKGLLQTSSDGTVRLMDFIDEQRMCRLYEKFILEYYRKEFPQIKASASQIPWILDDDAHEMLPIMQSDVMLEYGNKVLIIDAKYYAQNLQVQYDAYSVHSGNLYQIFTYVKNKTAELNGPEKTVSGMLLYAKTDEMVQPSGSYKMTGNTISVGTLDLNCDFAGIATQLNSVAEQYLGIPA